MSKKLKMIAQTPTKLADLPTSFWFCFMQNHGSSLVLIKHPIFNFLTFMSKHYKSITHYLHLSPKLISFFVLQFKPNITSNLHLSSSQKSCKFLEFLPLKMRTKANQALSFKVLLLGVFIAFLLLFVLRSSLSLSKQESPSPTSQTDLPRTLTPKEEAKSEDCSPSCTKIPKFLAQTLIHYTTSTITPQQTLKEISVSARILEKKSPCNFLVFGLGHDSLMWSSLNFGGRTIFLEEDEAWIEQIRRRFPMLESYHVTYDSKVNQANNLMEVGKGPECTVVSDPKFSMCQLALKGLPAEVYEMKWDLIMVDAPTGYYEEAPGRMTAIYTAGMMARNKEQGETEVFVHDVNRLVEDNFSKAFLCEGYMKKQEGRLRHFTIPSHREGPERPFCPE